MSQKQFSSFENLVNLFTEIGKKFTAGNNLLKDTVGWTGKNLLQIPSSVVTTTKNGITFTVNRNSDGEVTSIIADGTNSSSSDAVIFELVHDIRPYVEPDKVYILSGSNGGSNTTYAMGIRYEGYQYSGDKFITIDSSYADAVWYGIWIAPGASISNVTFYPMFRDACISDSTYEPYHASVEQTLRDAEVIEGKNLFGNIAGVSASDVVATKKDNGYDIATTSDGVYKNVYALFDNLMPNTDYIVHTFCDFTSGSGKIEISGSTTKYGTYTVIAGSNTLISADRDELITFNTGSVYKYFIVRFFVTYGTSESGHILYKNILLCPASEGINFEPYYIPLKDSKFDRAEQRVLGAKNLLPNNASAQTINGVTFTVNADGSVTANGTATATVFFNITPLGGLSRDLETYGLMLLSGCRNGSIVDGYELSVRSGNDNSNVTYNGNQLRQVDDEIELDFSQLYVGANRVAISDLSIIIKITNGKVLNNITFYPMLRLASDPDNTYAPYVMTNKELTTGKISSCSEIAGTVVANRLFKQGNLVILDLKITGLTKDAWNYFALIPKEYRPKYSFRTIMLDTTNNTIYQVAIPDSGMIQCISALDNKDIILHAVWSII